MAFKKSFPFHVSRTKETEAAYRRQSLLILSRYCSEIGYSMVEPACFARIPDKEEFVKWLAAYRDSVSASSWRNFKASLCFGILNGLWPHRYPWLKNVCIFETEIPGEYTDFYGKPVIVTPSHPCFGAEAEPAPTLPIPSGIISLPSTDLIALHDAVANIGTDRCVKATQTGSKKRKHISGAEISLIQRKLLSGVYTNTKVLTCHFFMTNLIVGLRPLEWRDAKLLVDGISFDYSRMNDPLVEVNGALIESMRGKDISLVVTNAKATNGRSHGKTRTLHIHADIPYEYLHSIVTHWVSAQKIADDGLYGYDGKTRAEKYDAFYTSCRVCLYRIVKKIWPRRAKTVSLYTSRHQSITDAKTVKSKKEVAASYGHGTDRTAGIHYGKKRYGNGARVFVTVDDESISRVKEVPDNWVAPDRSIDRGQRR